MFKNIANIDSFLNEQSSSIEEMSQFEELVVPMPRKKGKKSHFTSAFCVIVALAIVAGSVGYKKFTAINLNVCMFLLMKPPMPWRRCFLGFACKICLSIKTAAM